MMDVATPLGLPGHVSDVGETFAVWGIGEGPYLVLPVFSSSNLRDVVGLGIDSYADPLTYYLNENHMRWVALSRSLASGVSVYERNMDAIEDIKRTSLDYYSAIRSLSRQRRAGMINEAILGTVTPDTLSAQH